MWLPFPRGCDAEEALPVSVLKFRASDAGRAVVMGLQVCVSSSLGSSLCSLLVGPRHHRGPTLSTVRLPGQRGEGVAPPPPLVPDGSFSQLSLRVPDTHASLCCDPASCASQVGLSDEKLGIWNGSYTGFLPVRGCRVKEKVIEPEGVARESMVKGPNHYRIVGPRGQWCEWNPGRDGGVGKG